MSDIPLVFESLDGPEPGSEPMVDNITDTPLQRGLPPLEGYPDTQLGQQVGHVPGAGGEPGYPDVPEGYDRPYGSEEPQPDAARRNRIPARQRIAQLTQRYRQSENQNSELLAQIQDLQKKINMQEARMNQASRTPPAQEGYGASEPGSFDPNVIRQIVEEVVSPIREEMTSNRTQSQLRQSQDMSLAQAVRELPELGRPDSEAAEVFRELWASSPLRSHPDGPLHVAFQVKGVLAEERASEPEQEARKRAAQVIRPGPMPGVPAPSGAGREKQKLYDEAMKRVREGSATDDDYITARKIQRDRDRRFPRRR